MSAPVPRIGLAAAKNSRATPACRAWPGTVGIWAVTTAMAACHRLSNSGSDCPVPGVNGGSSRRARFSTASMAGRIFGGTSCSFACISCISACSAGVFCRAAIRSGTP